jgi:hypothetical protein
MPTVCYEGKLVGGSHSFLPDLRTLWIQTVSIQLKICNCLRVVSFMDFDLKESKTPLICVEDADEDPCHIVSCLLIRQRGHTRVVVPQQNVREPKKSIESVTVNLSHF